MQNKNLLKYWVTKIGNHIGSTVVARVTKPAGGHWVDITDCLGLCCRQTLQSAVFDFVASPDDILPTIVLQWNEIVGATYTVERSTSADFSTDLVVVITTTDETHNDEDLEFETTYYYRISATGDGLAQGPYSYASATTASE